MTFKWEHYGDYFSAQTTDIEIFPQKASIDIWWAIIWIGHINTSEIPWSINYLILRKWIVWKDYYSPEWQNTIMIKLCLLSDSLLNLGSRPSFSGKKIWLSNKTLVRHPTCLSCWYIYDQSCVSQATKDVRFLKNLFSTSFPKWITPEN